MLDWLNEVAGPGFAQAVLWTGLALLLLIVLLVIVKLVRSMTFGTFVAGGRNRKARLAVMDAAAVDSHRRLVLIRRDDIEHLLLIGGPTDVVVERDIRLGSIARRPAPASDAAAAESPQPVDRQPVPPASPVQRPRVPESARLPPQAASRPPNGIQTPQRAPEPQRPIEVVSSSRPALPKPEPARPVAASTPTPYVSSPMTPRSETRTHPQAAPHIPMPQPTAPKASNQAAPVDNLDNELLKELEDSLDDKQAPPKPAARSLDDEMSKLLGELANPRR